METPNILGRISITDDGTDTILYQVPFDSAGQGNIIQTLVTGLYIYAEASSSFVRIYLLEDITASPGLSDCILRTRSPGVAADASREYSLAWTLPSDNEGDGTTVGLRAEVEGVGSTKDVHITLFGTETVIR